MGNVLDAILKKTIDQQQIVNADYYSPIIDIDNREDEFSVQVIYENGINVDMVLQLEVSVDGTNFSVINEADQTIVDDSGSHIWDVFGSGVTYLRVKIQVNSGSIDINKIIYSGKRRH